MVKAGLGGSGVSGDRIESLRDVSLDMLNQFVASADPLVYRRCHYVVGENARLLAACDDLQKGDIGSFGQRMFATHEGLSKDYEVSCAELDFLVEAVKGQPGVLGARMMGGGFGGCTINLVREEAIGELAAKVSVAYTKTMNRELTTYKAQIENGVSLL
jgi:galactokinase